MILARTKLPNQFCSLLTSALMISIESSSCQMLNQSAVCPKLRQPHSLLFLSGITFYTYSASPPNHTTPSIPLREGCRQMSKTVKSVKGSCDF